MPNVEREYVTRESLMEATGRDKTMITDKLLDIINTAIYEEPEVGTFIMENFTTYVDVLKQGKYTTESYLNAVMFVSHKLMNKSNQAAYIATFPDRYTTLRHRYVDIDGLTETEFKKKISPYVYAVSKSELVISMLTQAQIPTKLLNMHLLQEAINVEADLMYNARSEMVKEKAASTLITYLGVEEKEAAIQVEVGIKSDERIDKYEELLKSMAEAQLSQMKEGGDVKSLTNIKIVDTEVVE
jgi:hypothetical protein